MTAAGPMVVPPFAVITGAQVQQALQGREKEIVDLVEETYRLHGAGDSVNPPSYFLRFPDRPSSRIIGLPASIGGRVRVDGLKWISSFPENVAAGIPRASAVLILNDHDSGYPFACLESSVISATRTAASAASAADWLSRDRQRPRRVGFFGVGLIARYIHTFLAATGWSFDEVGLYDLSADSTEGFRGHLDRSGAARPDHGARQRRGPDPRQRPGRVRHGRRRNRTSTIRRGSTTTRWCCTSRCGTWPRRSCSTSTNIVDDVEHCLKANTSPHLAEQLTGNREFLDGTLDDVMAGRVSGAGRPARWCSRPSASGCSTSPSASTSTTRWPTPATCTSSTGFFSELRRHG